MIKQAVIVKLEDKPVMVLPITTFQSASDYVKFEQECYKNLSDKIEEYKSVIQSLNQRIDDNVKEIKKLHAELKYVKGEITEEEYSEIIGEGE